MFEGGQLILHNSHIDPYTKSAIVYNHDPRRDRQLLVHKRELKKIEDESQQKGTTLVPLAIYFKDGRGKIGIGCGQGQTAVRQAGDDQEKRTGPRTSPTDDVTSKLRKAVHVLVQTPVPR